MLDRSDRIMNLCSHKKRVCKKNIVCLRPGKVLAAAVLLMCLCPVVFMTSGCGRQEISVEEKADVDAQTEPALITVGFSQLGAESDWRKANTASMVETFTPENGYTLLMENGQQQQANQITSIRRFIQQEVDVIVLAPVTEDGWDTVLQEAKEADIPVIIADRMVNVKDDGLYVCRVGSDFELEGRKAAEWLRRFAEEEEISPEDLHIVDIQGTIGATAQIGRTTSLEEAAAENRWDLMAEVTGDFTQSRGYEAMKSLLKEYNNINVVYCENDNSALGAIEAIEEAGKKSGSKIEEGDILVISFDGVNSEAIHDALNDRITCIAECNPEQGPMISSIIQDIFAGRQPEKISYVEEGVYSAYEPVSTITLDGTEYPVTILTEEVIASKDYWSDK